jgi:hypothetical protein
MTLKHFPFAAFRYLLMFLHQMPTALVASRLHNLSLARSPWEGSLEKDLTIRSRTKL